MSSLSYRSCWDAIRSIRIGKYIQTQAVSLSCCRPPHVVQLYAKETTIGTDHCHPAVSSINVYVPVVLNLVTDLYLMTIPMPVSFIFTLISCIESAEL